MPKTTSFTIFNRAFNGLMLDLWHPMIQTLFGNKILHIFQFVARHLRHSLHIREKWRKVVLVEVVCSLAK